MKLDLVNYLNRQLKEMMIFRWKIDGNKVHKRRCNEIHHRKNIYSWIGFKDYK